MHRAANAKPFLFPDDPNIKALVSDAAEAGALFGTRLPYAHLDDIGAIVGLILKFAAPLDETLRRLSATRQM